MKYGVVRALAFFGGAVLTLSAILVVLGVVVGLVRDSDVRESVGWALAVGGVLVALLVGGSGSTTVNYTGVGTSSGAATSSARAFHSPRRLSPGRSSASPARRSGF